MRSTRSTGHLCKLFFLLRLAARCQVRVAKPEKTSVEKYCSVEFTVCIDQTKSTFKLYCTKVPFSHLSVSLAQFFFVFQYLVNLAPPLFLDSHDRREISRENPLAAKKQGGRNPPPLSRNRITFSRNPGRKQENGFLFIQTFSTLVYRQKKPGLGETTHLFPCGARIHVFFFEIPSK